MSGCPERLFEVERVQKVADSIATKRKGRLISFSEKKLRRFERERRELLERFLGLLFSFDPENMDEAGYEGVDAAIALVLSVLDSHRDDPFNADALEKVSQARELIASGYPPSRPPTDEDMKELERRSSASLFAEFR